MKTPKSLLFIALASLSLVACKKDLTTNEHNPTPVTPKPSSLKEVVADKNFNWKTSREVVFDVEGTPTDAVVKALLTIESAKGEIFVAHYHTMSESVSIRLTVPNHITSLIMNYGAISKTYNLAGTNVKADFLPELAPVE